MQDTPQHPLDVERYHPDELRPYHRNPRLGDVEAIARSQEVNGQYRPIVVNLGRHTGRPLEVLAGNHTLAAAKHLGWAKIAATTVDVDDMEAARIVAADNRTADLGGYDDAVLIGLLQELPDLDGTGYTEDDLDDLLLLGEQADLDALADELGDEEPSDGLTPVGLRLQPSTADHWATHRKAYDTDSEALDALLDREPL